MNQNRRKQIAAVITQIESISMEMLNESISMLMLNEIKGKLDDAKNEIESIMGVKSSTRTACLSLSKAAKSTVLLRKPSTGLVRLMRSWIQSSLHGKTLTLSL